MQIKVNMRCPFKLIKLAIMKENIWFFKTAFGKLFDKIPSQEKFTDFSSQKFYF